MPHHFHIPVMGTCFTADTPMRVSHLGIDSAISLVDDRLLEQIGLHYAEEHSLPYEKVPAKTPHARALRFLHYLNLVNHVAKQNFQRVLKAPFNGNSEKDLYFRLLPADDSLRARYFQMLSTPQGSSRFQEEEFLSSQMTAGAIDVNIMVKLDRDGFDDAKEALRGYAESDLRGNTSLILSAGINQSLFAEMEKFPCFYRNNEGSFDKKITLKISDFRSAYIQGKFLSRKGLEISEYRIESGLNCGGHLFPAEGELLPSILKEFSEKKGKLLSDFQKSVEKYYTSHGWDLNRLKVPLQPRFCAQGGIGNYGEAKRLMDVYGMDRCGWGSPFLLVPEATLVDEKTRNLLAIATEDDISQSHASPLGVPFSHLKTCGAECDRLEKIQRGIPGAPCVKGFLQDNTEFSKTPICTASREYQKRKLSQIESQNISEKEKSRQKKFVLEKTCICHELGNSALIALEIANELEAPPDICPGPNIAFFDRNYSLIEMVDFIYGRNDTLTSKTRPHMFATEISLYVKWFLEELENATGDAEKIDHLKIVAQNIKAGIALALDTAKSPKFPGENLESIQVAANSALPPLEKFLEKINL